MTPPLALFHHKAAGVAMNSAQDTESANPEPVLPRGKPVPSASDQWVDIEALDRDIWQIGTIKLKTAVRLDDLENIPRQDLQKAIRACFTAPIDIFIDEPPISEWFPPIKRWLHRTLSLELVPPALDNKLLQEDTQRLGQTDADVRSLIDKLVLVFVHNLTACTKQKRAIQQNAGLGYAGIAIAASLIGALLLQSASPLLFVLIWVALVGSHAAAQFPLQHWFCKRNTDIYTQQYIVALQTSTHKVSRCIGGRMTSLSKCFEEYVRKIDDLLAVGEHVENDESERDDGSYKNGQAFLRQQLLMWIPERVACLERYIRIKMHEAEFEYAKADFHGFLRTKSIFLQTLCLCALIAAGGIAVLFFGISADTNFIAKFMALSAGMLIMSAISGIFALKIAKQSYRDPAWNPPRKILRDFLEVDQWEVSRKFNTYIRIPARLQKAMNAIAHMEDNRSIRR